MRGTAQNQLHSCVHALLAQWAAWLNGATLNAQKRVGNLKASLLLICLSLCRSNVSLLSPSVLNVRALTRRSDHLAVIMAYLRDDTVPLVVSYLVMMFLSLVAVIMRFISIYILRRRIKAHDVLCVVSLVRRTRALTCPLLARS